MKSEEWGHAMESQKMSWDKESLMKTLIFVKF